MLAPEGEHDDLADSYALALAVLVYGRGDNADLAAYDRERETEILRS